MTRKTPKIKLSKHQKQNVETARPGHIYSEDDAEAVLANPLARMVEPETNRTRAWGRIRNKTVRVVTSATVSADVPILRMVTGHRDRLPKKR